MRSAAERQKMLSLLLVAFAGAGRDGLASSCLGSVKTVGSLEQGVRDGRAESVRKNSKTENMHVTLE